MIEFVFATCQAGAETALKTEIQERNRGLKLAYSRPGFVTFKSDGSVAHADFELGSVLAHSFGVSLGKAEGASSTERAAATAARAEELARSGGEWRLHVWDRRREAEGEGGTDATALVEAEIRAATSVFERETVPKVGDMVFDLAIVDEGEWWMGYHVHSHAHRPWPGGRPPFELKSDAPSRGYLKLREGVAWAGLPLRKGERALELGASPGGASFALLELGLWVIGVDPADIDPRVVGDRRFRHIRRQALQIAADELERPDWLFCDMNVPPEEALPAALRLASDLRVKGGLITLKLKDWKQIANVPGYLEKIEKRGFRSVKAGHLFYGRTEICASFLGD
jgi:23S rRNA (cytidine2498-2'-O)-methyltransferase